jgi:Fe-S oxidoreductase
MGALTPALTNAVLTGPVTSPLIKYIVGVAQERKLPRLAAKSYRAAWVERELQAAKQAAQEALAAGLPKPAKAAPVVESEEAADGQTVLLWADTWNNYYHPRTLAAAESVLRQAGFQVRIFQKHICCGRALYDFGLLDTARSYVAGILERLAPEIEAGLPFIFLEPSCASVFKDEALQFFPDDPRAQKLSGQVWLLADWLAAKAPEWVNGRLQGAQVLIHGHCHHKAVFGGPANEIALLKKAGAAVELIDASCCGMAGPFGFEASKFEVSKAIANLGLLPAVEAAKPQTVIVADGFSCREQIEQLGHRQALHFAEILEQAGKDKN